MTDAVRVRFAPSPTGYLHVGGARTALFNWLFARHHHGKFILRIEDTDAARSSDEMVEGILQGLRWLGLDWDEGPHFQSRRIARYRDFAHQLLENGSAYRCFCRADNPAEDNAEQDQGQKWIYDHRCLTLSPGESGRLAEQGQPFGVRFHVPPGKTSYRDRVFGDIEVENSNIEDFVLLRSDGMPTYHLGVVVDDVDMAITHVIRGADHISNTPKQVLLYQAARLALPEFAHVPLILGSDKQRLSKRHGATSVTAYAAMGYLPEAFFNFLALLGWSPGGDREIMTRRELIESFSLEGVGKASAVFGLEKLDWFNGEYIRRTEPAELRKLVLAELKSRNILPQDASEQPSVDAAIDLLKTRARRLTDFSGTFRAFFTDDFDYQPDAVAKFMGEPNLKVLLPTLLEHYREDGPFSHERAESILRSVAESNGVKAGLLINSLRVGLTGQGVAPGLFDVMRVLGRERTLSRIERLIDFLNRGK
ncbi:MAG TPA: glutamate--tRNA ligase [Acidobacteriota bacterium]|nr:glutamate--tRNA ligase [Acidobacteriota bacterium]